MSQKFIFIDHQSDFGDLAPLPVEGTESVVLNCPLPIPRQSADQLHVNSNNLEALSNTVCEWTPHCIKSPKTD